MLPYLQVENLTKRWGPVVLFEDISFTIFQGQKVALIARNGTGKSTLLDVITGKNSQDDGKITFTNDITTGYLPQNPELDDSLTVMQQTYLSDNPQVAAIRDYEEALRSGDKKHLEDSMHMMDSLGAWDFEVRIKQILTELKITDFNQKIGELSGGQKKRVALAHVLINEPDLLILDEPTNHLDLEMIEWLENYLTRTAATLFMITHDRYFLDRVCNEILEIDNGNLYRYRGNYSYFLEKKEERQQILTSEVDKAQNILRTELEWLRRMPKARGTKARYRVENVDKLQDKASQRHNEEDIDIQVRSSRLGSKIINIHHLYKSFDELQIMNDFSYNFARFEKVGIVGDNGTGKTTFLNLITGMIPPDKGVVEIGETIRFGFYRQEGIDFNPGDRVIDAVNRIAEVVDMGNGRKLTATQFLYQFQFSHEVQYNYIEKLSGGERRRLYLCTVLMQNPNFLILDEPTNDLDIMTLNVLEEYLRTFDGCVIVVSHDRYFMDKIVDHLFVFEGDGQIKDFPGNYTQYRDCKSEQEKELKKASEPEKKSVERVKQEKPRKMSFNEKREFEQLEKEIGELETEKQQLELDLSSGLLNSDDIQIKSLRYSEIKDLLDEKELRWLELSEL
ncbi:MAG: ABC-F family ATP-binding cassette domain-containing protein [Bacteroidota bacterium]|nr:ABC-F family ATP-binding cassette domain-containing protein [Bacteroidota bacterium]